MEYRDIAGSQGLESRFFIRQALFNVLSLILRQLCLKKPTVPHNVVAMCAQASQLSLDHLLASCMVTRAVSYTAYRHACKRCPAVTFLKMS
jgi:hypothetical protein